MSDKSDYETTVPAADGNGQLKVRVNFVPGISAQHPQVRELIRILARQAARDYWDEHMNAPREGEEGDK